MRPFFGSTTSPKALTTTKAATVTPDTVNAALPMPPFMARWGPNTLPTVAPVPAPTLPMPTGAELALVQAIQPLMRSGRMRASPTPRSKITAAGTMGTRTGPTGKPWPCCSNHCMTPDAASKPKALPPESKTACTWGTELWGASTSVSRVPGAAPRTSTPPTVPSGQITTVQPVGRSLKRWCPTNMP